MLLFAENGYEVTVCDPAFANYQWIPDLSIYDEYPEIHAYNTKGTMNSEDYCYYIIEANKRNFFCFGLMKCMPLMAQLMMYDGGNYNITRRANMKDYSNQVVEGLSKASGSGHLFMRSYNVLDNLHTITNVTDESKNTFFFMKNDTTHNPVLLQAPDYVPSTFVDNTQYDAEHAGRFTLEDGSTLNVDSMIEMTHYHANMAALLRLAEWMDYLRENGVYDNTKIILVADHGSLSLDQADALNAPDGAIEGFIPEGYFPLLMVKDFNSKGFTVSEEFMTNADVPSLAVEGIIENPVNPFTGKLITSDEKYAHEQIIIRSGIIDTAENTGTTFQPSTWASVKDDIWNQDNWTFSDVNTVLTEHVLP